MRLVVGLVLSLAVAVGGFVLPSPVRANAITSFVIAEACFGDAAYGGCGIADEGGPWSATDPTAACQKVPLPSTGYHGAGWQFVGIQNNNHCIWRSYDPQDGGCAVDCGAGSAVITSSTIQGPACPSAGTETPDDGNRYSTNPGNHNMFCHQGCAYWPVAVSQGSNESYGGTISTGKSCSSTGQNVDLTMPEAPQMPAPTGSSDGSGGDTPTKCTAPTACSGTVGSTTVCVDCGVSSGNSASYTNGTTTSGGNVPGDVTLTSNEPLTDGSGGTKTTTTVYHPDGTITTTITTSGGVSGGVKPGQGGSSGGGGTGSGGGNCTGTDCGNSDYFGGSCGASFVCDGDAVQCAIAKEQHFRACQMYEPATVGGDWATGAQLLATAKADGDVPSWSPAAPANAVTTNMDWSTTIDQSSAWGGACPADVVVGGVTLSFAALCPHMQTLGVFLQAMTAIACAFILFKGTK